jgi:hypothetical protein
VKPWPIRIIAGLTAREVFVYPGPVEFQRNGRTHQMRIDEQIEPSIVEWERGKRVVVLEVGG